MFHLLSITCRITLKKNKVFYLHCASTQFSEHKMMKKILFNEKKKKFRFHETPLLLSPANISKGSYEGKRSGNSKRVNVLNKLFMRYITDLMASGERAIELFGHGIEFNRVKVTPDYKAVHVFWICSDVAKEEDVENYLKSIAGDLRCELANLNLIGLIPKIMFFKDKDYARILRVDERLSIADFGEDHEPQQYKNNFRTELKLQMRLDEGIKSKISNLEKNIADVDLENPLPEMPQNILGLDHASILNKVLKRLKQTEISPNALLPVVMQSATVNNSPIRFPNTNAQNEAFKEFLVKRKILEIQAKRERGNHQPELEYAQEEITTGNNYDNNVVKDTFLDDFIEDEEQ